MQMYRVKLLPLRGLLSRLRLGGSRTVNVNSALAHPVGGSTWIGVTIAIALMLAVSGLIAHTWAAIGDTAISRAGWVAIALGILVTLGLGTGLMSLVFISNREGFDEAVGATRVAAQSTPTRLAARSAASGGKIEVG